MTSPTTAWPCARTIIGPWVASSSRPARIRATPPASGASTICFDDRVDDQKELLELNQRPVIKPTEEKFYPAAENLKMARAKADGEVLNG